MATPPRALDVHAPFTLYCVVGRRPSAVYLDQDRRPCAPDGDDETGDRLWEPVFQRIEVQPGDQIQEQSSGYVLVQGEERPVSVRLEQPVARTLDNAFTQAAESYAIDSARIDTLIAAGALSEAAKRIRPPDQTLPPQTDMPAEHPLVRD